MEGLAIRQVTRKIGISRSTVRKYLQVPEPIRREKGSRVRLGLEEVIPHMDELLEEWGLTDNVQAAEHGYTYPPVVN